MMKSFSVSRIKTSIGGMSKTELAVLAALILALILIVLYFTGILSANLEARKWKQEFEAQKTIIEAEKKKRTDAEAEAARNAQIASQWKTEADKQAGISQALREEFGNAVDDLKQTQTRSQASSQALRDFRSGARRPAPARTDDELRDRLRSGADEFRRDDHD